MIMIKAEKNLIKFNKILYANYINICTQNIII